MMHQAKKLTWLVENFVSLEGAAQHTVADRKAVCPQDLLNETLTSARLIAEDKQIQLSIEGCSTPLPHVYANHLAISQVLDNLVANAIKFTKAGGHIRLSARPVQGAVEFIVCDTGIGIPKEAQKQVFDRFYQVDGSARRRYGGVGIGLSVCKALIEAHGGQIRLESEPGVGTTFSFTLPIVPTSD